MGAAMPGIGPDMGMGGGPAGLGGMGGGGLPGLGGPDFSKFLKK
jgi:hypothetical protein